MRLSSVLIVVNLYCVHILVLPSHGQGVYSGTVPIPSPGANTSTLINTTGNVNHIEPDLYIQDNLLFADGDELKTTNCLTIQSLGLSANLMSGFIQLSDSLVVAVDFYNHCLRSLNRVTQQTSIYSGVCMEPDWVDGEEPKFRQPSSVIRDVMSTAVLIITEHGNEALRTINMNNMTGGTLIRSSLLSNPHGLTQHPTSGDLYISVHHSIVTYHYSQKVLTILTGSGHPSFQDGRFSEAAFYYPAAVLLLLEANQLIVSDNTNYRLRILDLDTSTTSSICSGVYGQVDGNLRTCQLLEVAAVTVIDGVLYIGESKSIRFIGRGNRTVPVQSTTTESVIPKASTTTVPMVIRTTLTSNSTIKNIITARPKSTTKARGNSASEFVGAETWMMIVIAITSSLPSL